MQSVTSFNTSTNWCLGHTRLTAIRSLQEMDSSRAVLRVALQLVLNMRWRSVLYMPPKQLYGSTTVLAAELCIAIDQRLGNQLHLPERFVSTSGTYSPALHFTLIKLFALDCHSAPPDTGCLSLFPSFRSTARKSFSVLTKSSTRQDDPKALPHAHRSPS